MVGTIIAAILMAGGMALLGMPGGFYSLAAAPVAELLRGLPAGSMLDGERAWPVAIMMTLAVPPALPLALLLVGWLRPAAKELETMAWVATAVYLWAIASLVIFA